jgi:hypothetical protein
MYIAVNSSGAPSALAVGWNGAGGASGNRGGGENLRKGGRLC